MRRGNHPSILLVGTVVDVVAHKTPKILSVASKFVGTVWYNNNALLYFLSIREDA